MEWMNWFELILEWSDWEGAECYGERWSVEFDVNKCVCVRELIIGGYWLSD